MTPQEIYKAARAKLDEARALRASQLAATVAEKRDRTEDEIKAVDALIEEAQRLKNEADRVHAEERLERELAEGERRADPNPIDKPEPERRAREPSEEQRALALEAWMCCGGPRGNDVTDRHREACRAVGINPASPELCIRLPRHDRFRRARDAGWGGGWGRSYVGAEERALSAIIGATGGFTVPTTMMNQLEVNLLAFGGVLQAAETIRTAAGERMSWPTADDTSNSGVQIGESTAVTTTDPSFGAVFWDAYKFSSKEILVPFELLNDSAFDLPGVLGAMLGERLGRILNTKFTTGTGAATPNGIVTASALGKTTASATAITWDEIIDLTHSVDPAYRQGSAFMFHDGIMQHVRKLKGGSSSEYLWADGPNSTPPATLMGYPYFINQDMQSTVATATKTMLFGRLSNYKVRMVGDIRLYRLAERHRESDQDAFLAFIRADGNLLTAGTNPVKHMLQA